MAESKHPNPLPLWPAGSNFPRKGLWRGSALPPAVHMRTTVDLRPSLAAKQDKPSEILLSVVQAASGALALHPRLNFFNYWGRLVWAGEPMRVAVVMENRDLTCDLVVVSDAHRMNRETLQSRIRDGRGQVPSGPMQQLREAWPWAGYMLERFTGAYQKGAQQSRAPLYVSMLGLPGIESLTYTPTSSMALYPGWPVDGKLPLTLCFGHQLANARPVGRFLLTVKELLE